MEEKNKKTSKNLIEMLKEEQELLAFQEKYEKGIILEENLTEDEKEKLINLYKKQIEQLKSKSIEYKRQLYIYKNKILEIRNKSNE